MRDFDKWWDNNKFLLAEKQTTTTAPDFHEKIAMIAWYASKDDSARKRIKCKGDKK